MYEALASLPDEYTILHSVAWQGRQGDRDRDGEADFLVVHSRGLLVIEVKGGGIRVENGQWKSRDQYGETYNIKNPFEQATTSKAVLIKWLQDRVDFYVPACHAVVFPDVWELPELGPAGSTDLMLTRQHLRAVHDAVRRAFSHARRDTRLHLSQIKDIANALAPTVTVRRRLSDVAREAQSELIVLTDEQKEFFNAARRNVRLAVFGGAGTGKTVLACEKARQLHAEGNRVLLTCYNRPLADTLSADSSLKGVDVRNFHALCMDTARKADLEIPKNLDRKFWEEDAALLLMDAADHTGTSFDAVVVDEGQDFSAEWITALESICAHDKDSPFVVFFDPNQQLWDRPLSLDASYFHLELTRNCRNTLPIAERVANIVASDVWHKGVSGPAPKWTQWISPAKLEIRVKRIIGDLFEEGFSAEDIVVLCESRTVADRLRKADLGDVSMNPYERDLFLLERALGSTGDEPDRIEKKFLRCETIARFKGLEALAVVLVLNAESRSAPDKNAYVGFSRAVSYLHILAHPSRQRAVRWV